MSDAEAHLPALLPAYAVGALSAEEAEAVRRHLQTCGACREELQTYEAIAADLALTVPAVEPPAALEERLLARLPSRTRAAPRPTWTARLREWLNLAWSQLGGRRAWAPVAALALLLALFLLWSGIRYRAPFATFPTVALSGTNVAPEASGIVISSEDGLHGTLVVQRLEPLDEETETYQLWLIRAEQWEDGGTFSVDADGYDAHYARASILLTAYDAFAVTVEPAGGSRTPTGPLVLHGEK